MKKSSFADQQIAFPLQQAEDGALGDEVCCKMGVSLATFFLWKKVIHGLMPSEVG
ncbi:MAG: transposase [Candidatus Acidiferrales bacterium]